MATNDVVCNIGTSVDNLSNKLDTLIEVEKEKNEYLLKIRNSLANIASIQAIADLHPYINVEEGFKKVCEELERIADSIENLADMKTKSDNAQDADNITQPNVKYYTPKVYTVHYDIPEEEWWDDDDTSKLSWFFT